MSKCLTRQSEVRSDVGKALENNSRWYQDCCRSWFVCAASLMSVIVVSGIALSYGLLLPSLMDAFEATRQETGKSQRYKTSALSVLNRKCVQHPSPNTDQITTTTTLTDRSYFLIFYTVKRQNQNRSYLEAL